jgi:predicted permease
MSPEEARRAARRGFGDPYTVKDEARDTWRWRRVDELVQDVRYAVRSLVAQPSFTAMTLVALIVGIGVNTSLFTALNAVLFRPWNVTDAKDVVHLLSLHPRHGYGGLPIASASYFQENARTIESAFSERFYQVTLDEAVAGGAVAVALVSGGYFDVLDVDLTAGRAFAEHEDVPRAPTAVAVMSHALWSERYAADPGVVGSTIRLDGAIFTVIGVAEKSFLGTGADRIDVWAPLSAMTLLRPTDAVSLARLTDPEWCCSDMYARLSPGSRRDQASAELSALFRQFSVGAAQDEIDVAVIGTALFDHPEERGRAARIVAISLAALGSILLLACANVSNMLLARGTARQGEIAVRMAMGAARGRLVRQLLTESLLLAGIAALASVLLTPILPRLVLRLRGQRVPTNLDFTPDGTVLAYAMAIAVFAALAFGLAPAFRGTRVSVSETLKGQNARVSGRFPLQGALIGVQVAVSVALLMTAGLLLRGLDRAGSLDLGFRTDGVTALRVQLPPNAYDPAAERRFFDDLLPLLQASGARVGMSSLLPLGDARNFTDFVVPDATLDVSQAMPVQDATPGYFEVLGIPVLVGRTFRPGDRDLGAIMVNESLARLYWPDRSPIGQSVTIGNRPREVVGVVRDAQLNGIGSRGPTYFSPFAANSQGVGEPPVILLPSPMASSAAAVVRAADATAFTEAIPLSEQAHRSLGDARGSARLAGVLACVALLLATSGVYGVISCSVEHRRREIMIRVALGARPRGVVGLVLRRNATPIGLGIVVGLVISAGGSVLLNSQLYGLSPLDPAALAGVATVLLVAGAAASTIPARRAVRMDPVAALHQE